MCVNVECVQTAFSTRALVLHIISEWGSSVNLRNDLMKRTLKEAPFLRVDDEDMDLKVEYRARLWWESDACGLVVVPNPIPDGFFPSQRHISA